MPLYSYVCRDCGQECEEFRSMANRHATMRCHKCEGVMDLEFQAPSALRTDTQFQRGIHFNDGLRNDKDRRHAAALAKRMGVNIQGKRYDGRVARFPLDPLAFYGDRAEARAAVIRSGQASEELGVKAKVDEDTGKPYRVAEDVVERHAKDRVITEHGGSVPREKWNTIKEEVREAITPKTPEVAKCLQ